MPGPAPRIVARVALAVTLLLVAIVFTFAAPRWLAAESMVWNGGVGDFDDNLKWSPGQVPGPADDAFINLDADSSVTTSSSHALHSLTVGAGSGTHTETFSMSPGTTLNLSANLALQAHGRFQGQGTVSVQTTYSQAAGSQRDIVIGGPFAYDKIAVVGTATLAGTLNVTLGGGYCPDESFTIMTYASHTGDFTTLNLPALGSGRSWSASASAGATSYVLTVNGPICDADGDGYSDTREIVLHKDANTYCAIMRADVDGDGTVSILDLAATASHFLQAVDANNTRFNQDHDASISILDLAAEAGHFLQTVDACP